MIKSREEYRLARQRLDEDRRIAEEQEAALRAAGLKGEEVARAMAPILSFHAQLEEEVRWYERIQRGDFSSLDSLEAVGRLLVAIRIARGISQQELAERLQCDVAQVIRDERDEYYGFTLPELARVARALRARVVTRVERDDAAETASVAAD